MVVRILASLAIILLPTYLVAQELPIADGSYIDVEACEQAARNELDLVEFTVTTKGRGVSFEEGSCLVASITHVRGKRYHVDLDCQEFGDLYQYQFFLDVIGPEHIRLDGVDKWLCKKGFLGGGLAEEGSNPDLDSLVTVWDDAAEKCLGGPGDNPSTDQACSLRDQAVEQLGIKGFCYGREGQSRSEFDWHKCGENSFK